MKMKRKSTTKRKNTLRIVGVCAVCALAVRLICMTGAEETLRQGLMRAAQSTEFVSLAMGTETNDFLTGNQEKDQKWLSILRSESPVFASVDDLAERAQLSEAEEQEVQMSLVPWSLTTPPPAEEKKDASDAQAGQKKEYPIKAISINPTSPNGYTTLGKIYLKNDSSQTIDLNSYLKADMPFALKGEGPHVLIVHTHGSESYFPAGRDTYTLDDVERTSDKNYNVIRVGDEIEKILKEKGISVIHDRNIYDSPSYNGSYTRTLEAITKQMQKTPSIKVILDIHRDAMTTKEGVKYKTYATVNGQPSAQLMLVMSTGESGLPHPNWKENLKFAVKLQCQIANKYPGLMRPINLRKDRFNMHVTTGSMLVEVGTSANSLQEALTAIRPFSEELAALLKSVKK